jgi:Uma2 family endonuclease
MTGPQPQKKQKLSVEEYLALEKDAESKHEYVNGTTFAMTGVSRSHAAISLNIAVALRNLLKGSGCNVFVSDFKVHAVAANSFYYPDVVVECGHSAQSEFFTLTRPR